MPSDLERAMETLITVFHRYAGKEGDSNTLSRRELRQLMEAELANFLKVPHKHLTLVLEAFLSSLQLIMLADFVSLVLSLVFYSVTQTFHIDFPPYQTMSL